MFQTLFQVTCPLLIYLHITVSICITKPLCPHFSHFSLDFNIPFAILLLWVGVLVWVRRATWPTLAAHAAVNFAADFGLLEAIVNRASGAETDWASAKTSWRSGLCLEGSLYIDKRTGQVVRCLGSRGDSANHGAALAWPMFPALKTF